MEYRGKAVTNVVSQPMGDHIIGVQVSSRPVILPKIDDFPVKPPRISRCFDRHVIRTDQGVVIVEVTARVKVLPLSVPFSQLMDAAREELDIALKEENKQPEAQAYTEGLYALANRMAWKLRKQGVKVLT